MYFLFSWMYLASLGWRFPSAAFGRVGFVDKYCLSAYSSVSWTFMSEKSLFSTFSFTQVSASYIVSSISDILNSISCILLVMHESVFPVCLPGLFFIYRILSVCIFYCFYFIFQILNSFFVSFLLLFDLFWLFRLSLKDLFISPHCFMCLLGYL